jgi:hypothetical protein
VGRLPSNYLGPKGRIQMLKNDYSGDKSSILTEATTVVVGDTLCILVKATIMVLDKVVAQGHAFTDCPEEEKAVEKAETIAIGRALVNFGYPETLDEVEEVEEKKSTKSASSAKPKEEAKKETKSTSGLTKLSKKAEPEDEEDDQEEELSEEEEEEDEESDEEDGDSEDVPVVDKPKPRYSHEALMAKYTK